MSFAEDAFGPFDRQHDADAALKFCLEILLSDKRTEKFFELVSPGSGFGGFGGDPGWEIEWRWPSELQGFEEWPANASFHAWVDPDEFWLANPDFYCDAPTFVSYLSRALISYKAQNPDFQIQTSLLERLPLLFSHPSS